MALFPRRSRSMLLKIVLLIPAAWFLIILVFSYQDGSSSNNHGNDAHPDVGLLNDQAEEARIRRKVAEDQNKNSNQLANDNNNLAKQKALEGPPIKDAGGADREEDKGAINHKANIPMPKRFVIDPDNPIYKKGDPNQAGELGKPVNVKKEDLSPDKKKLFDDGWQNNAFNQYASDMISLHRTLPDQIDKECLSEKYTDNLPDTSVIVCFHNEAWSVLLRTVHSIVERTPPELLKEVILVDDFSDKDHLKQPLVDYMAQFPKVKIVRMEKREGLIRARLKGAVHAKGKVLTYLDSHCECMEGWAQPLLDRIKKDPHTVVCPVIDVIDDSTFEYHYSKAYFTNVGGFDWSLQFNWHPIPDRDRKNRKRDIDPVPSPTMAGGLFAIDRDYFEYLGTYDPGFDIWGGENLEISFKIWMCGGRLEIVPCSHVGHIFRKRSPYKWRSGVNVLKRNTIRLAEVWLDEYKKYYYERINFNLGDYGDISERKALRERINCKSFRWYLDNIFPELFIPGDAVASGEVRNRGLAGKFCLDSPVGKAHNNKPVSGYPCHGQGGNQVRNSALKGQFCLDSPVGEEQNNKPVSAYPCHGQGGNQYWMLSKDGEIRRDESCIDFAGQDVMIFPCHGMKGNQHWKYDHKTHRLMHTVTNKCLQMSDDGSKLAMSACDTNNDFQQWVFKQYDEAKAASANML